MRRILVLLAILTAVTFAGCSSRQYHAAWCGFHGWRLVHDVRTHHLGFAAFQAAMAAHNCSRAIHP